MVAFTFIAGILLVLAGVACLFTPVETFMAVGIYIGLLFLIYGIAGIAKALQKKSTISEIIISILAVAVGVVSFVKPGTTLIFDFILLVLVAFWFIIQGVLTFRLAIELRKIKRFWLLQAIFGIISIGLGIYSLIHTQFAAMATGYLIAIYFIESGINMIVLAMAAEALKKGIDELTPKY